MTYLIGSVLMIGSLVASLTAAFAGATGGTFGVVMLAALIGWNLLSADKERAPARNPEARPAPAPEPRFTMGDIREGAAPGPAGRAPRNLSLPPSLMGERARTPRSRGSHGKSLSVRHTDERP
ncbi:MAG: hypothetical protein AB7U38_06870 [Hyphomicrobiales bacterium]